MQLRVTEEHRDGLDALLLDALAAKRARLTALHRARTTHLTEYTANDIAAFWLLHAVNRNYAHLRHLHDTAPVRPGERYMALAELLGELLTFTHDDALADLPPYRHDDPAAAGARRRAPRYA